MSDARALDLEGIEFGWRRGAPVLQIERFAVNRGERVFVSGPSGSGKSTLLGVIGGVLAPQAGRVQVLGQDLGRLPAAARDRFRGEHVGFIFQMFNLVPYLSVLENVLLPVRFSPARLARLGERGEREEAVRLLDALGLTASGLLDRAVTQLSVGQQQRVAAARALLGRPELVVADEPTSALDADAKRGFLELLLRECDAIGSSLVFVSHEAALGTRFDRTVAMPDLNRGRPAAA